MGIFNTKIFDELEDGLKRLSKRIKTNIEDDNKKILFKKCPNCGATLSQFQKDKIIKCPYCSIQIINLNYKENWFEDLTK